MFSTPPDTKVQLSLLSLLLWRPPSLAAKSVGGTVLVSHVNDLRSACPVGAKAQFLPSSRERHMYEDPPEKAPTNILELSIGLTVKANSGGGGGELWTGIS
jgi:hypothetical protein